MKPSLALAQNREALRLAVQRSGVLRPRIFGSVITQTDGEDSDLDLLVEPTASTTLLTLATLQNEAERLLGVRVDVVTPKALPRQFRDEVLAVSVPL